MINNDLRLNVIIWREMKRQEHLKYIILIQLIIYIIILNILINKMNVFKLYLDSTIIFAFITQNDIFFYDLDNSIESLLSTSLNIKHLIKEKSLFIVIKSYMFSILVFIIYIFKINNNYHQITNINILDVIFFIEMILFEYYFNIFIGTLIWILGKRLKWWLYIGQSLIFLILSNMLNISNFELLIIAFSVIILVLGLSKIILFKYILNEILIERSF